MFEGDFFGVAAGYFGGDYWTDVGEALETPAGDTPVDLTGQVTDFTSL